MAGFQSKGAVYGTVMKKHDKECDLIDDIDVSQFQVRPYSSVFTVRRFQNDDLFPYDASAFLGWFIRSSTDPQTRENLSYITRRVDFKRSCFAMFPALNFGTLDKEFVQNLWTTVAVPLLQQAEHNVKPRLNLDEDIMKVRAFVDLNTLDNLGLVWHTLDFDSTLKKLTSDNLPIGTWLMRRSSQHNYMPNAEVICIAYLRNVVDLDGKTSVVCYQMRLVNVLGVGWYSSFSTDDLTSFKKFVMKRGYSSTTVPTPEYLSIFDILIELKEDGKIIFDQLI